MTNLCRRDNLGSCPAGNLPAGRLEENPDAFPGQTAPARDTAAFS
jgi:hypothetical protein